MRDVLIAVVLGLFFSIPPVVASVFAYKILQAVKTPSGDPIGHVAERTEHIASTNHAQLLRQGRVLTDGQIDEVYGRVSECLELLDALRKGRH